MRKIMTVALAVSLFVAAGCCGTGKCAPKKAPACNPCGAPAPVCSPCGK